MTSDITISESELNLDMSHFIDGMPKLNNNILAEIPRDPHVFVADQLTTHDYNGGDPDRIYHGIKVVLAHGIFDNVTHAPKFLGDGSLIDPAVEEYNQGHENNPVRMVIACMGSQRPIAENEMEGSIFMTPLAMVLNQTAFAVGTDLGVVLVKENGGEVKMVVSYNSKTGGIINWQMLQDLTSQSLEKDIQIS